MSAVVVALRVRATPAEAFAAFTEEIGQWWRPNALFQLTPRGDGALRFEPGEKLAFTWRQATFTPDQSTEVVVAFEAVGEETRITVTHRGWESVPQEHVARHGFPLGVFLQRQGEHWRALLGALSARF